MKKRQKVDRDVVMMAAMEWEVSTVEPETYTRDPVQVVPINNVPIRSKRYQAPAASRKQKERYFNAHVEADGDILWL